jgi:superfamily II DNA or RNA helicase
MVPFEPIIFRAKWGFTLGFICAYPLGQAYRSSPDFFAMPARLEDLTVGAQVRGILPGDAVVTIVATTPYGNSWDVVYRDARGGTNSELIDRSWEPRLSLLAQGRAFGFDADGARFRLVSEALRIRLAHLFDPVLAVHTSTVDPLPHQITAVYESMLPRQPLRFLLADDPGAGKTIMAGLLIKELMARGDLRRCLVIPPGSLTEQWQDELRDKFNLNFQICTNDNLEAAGSNWFLHNNLVIARLDKLARDEVTQGLLTHPDCQWDLIIFDEAHKLAASYTGNEIKYTQRYQLAQKLGPTTRHLLLMSATPHNGKDQDFELFMGLLDGDRFEGKRRDDARATDCSDMMRRMVKESLLKFDGTPLFPERRAHAVPYQLTEGENNLYSAVSAYVRDEFNRADQIADNKRKVSVGFALTLLQRRLASSPFAIQRSLQRRHDRLNTQLKELEMGQPRAVQVSAGGLIDEDDIDEIEDGLAGDSETAAGDVIDQATAAQTIAELRAEIAKLAELCALAEQVRRSGQDKKWTELNSLLSEVYQSGAGAPSNYDVPAAPEAGAPKRKLVIFTEHRDTLDYLHGRLQKFFGSDVPVGVIHGSMGRAERIVVQNEFKNLPEKLILLATDAAGEGINLQRAHLMVNYDLPWNPNRLEQRFGRIHRIGQTEVCHLWNLIAINTREGEVYKTLLDKLELARKALGGKVFDVLGKLQFEGASLRELLIDAIRYGEQPEVRAKLQQKVEGGVDQRHLSDLVEDRALTRSVLDRASVDKLRIEMQRAEAARLQPFYVEAFFREALKSLGGDIRAVPGEDRRYTIKSVPGVVMAHDGKVGSVAPILPRYERVTFEKAMLQPAGLPQAQFLCPGHPLLDATIDLTLEMNRNLLRQGAVLVDEHDVGTSPRVLFFVEHVIQDGVKQKVGEEELPRTVSKQMLYVESRADGTKQTYHYAPYLDYRPLKDADPRVDAFLARPELSWVLGDLERDAVGYAIENAIPDHMKRVSADRIALVDKTEYAVKERLKAAIRHWDHRAEELKLKEQAGGNPGRYNSQQARKRADELSARLQARLAQLALERHLVSKKPTVIGAALVIPAGLISKMQGHVPTGLSEPIDTQISAARARRIVMEYERTLGNQPTDRELEKLGYDVESIDQGSKKLRLIEVKGRQADADTITVTHNEIRYSLNQREQFILALVLFNADGSHQLYYISNPFDKEPGFTCASENHTVKRLIGLPGAKRIV